MNKTILFKGINRNNSITNNADGNCEEVMNLRPKQGRWEAVMRKKKAYRNDWIGKLEYSANIVKYHQHEIGDKINNIFIIHEEGNGDASDYRVKGVWVKEVGIDCEPVILWQIDTDVKYADVDSSLGIDIESVGNFLTFNLPEVTTFLWQDGEYKKTKQNELTAPKIKYNIQSRFSPSGALVNTYRYKEYGAQIGGYSFSDDKIHYEQSSSGVVFNSYTKAPVSAFNLQNTAVSTGKNMPLAFCNIQFTSDVNTEMQEKFGGIYKLLQEDTEDYREGFVFVCSAYEMFDGTFTNISAPIMLHLGTNGFTDYEDEDSFDTFYNRDKVQITEYHLNGYPSFTEKFGFNITAFVRRQRQQRLIFHRPDVPDGLGKEYAKIVYFVSKPISMYDFSSLDVHHLHINRMMAVYRSKEFNNRCFYDSIPQDGMDDPMIPVRFSLSNSMSILSVNGVPLGIKFADEELKEGLPMHLPTKEELENITFYKAVEFSIKDSDDIGEDYIDNISRYKGKAVNFTNLIEGEILNADTSSTETYKAKGLMTYNQRLHLYGVYAKFRANISTVSGNEFHVNIKDVVYKGYEEIPYTGMLHSNLYYAIYENNSDNANYSLYKYLAYAKYNIEIEGVIHSYISDLDLVSSPVLPFIDSRLKSVDIYWQGFDGYYYSTLSAFESKVYNLGFVDLWNFKRTGMEEINKDIVKIKITNEEYNYIKENAGTWITCSEVAQLNRLKVSNQSNPIIFPPELDYQFDDEIVALGNNYKEISLAQEGQYPTYVFTKKGIWAMGVGSSAFYSTQVPINPDVAVSRSTLGIGNGVVYVAKDGIKVLNGREVVSISEPLRGHISHIDDLISVRSALGLGQFPNRLNTIYKDIYGSFRIVEERVEEYLFGPNTVLGYDRTNNEVIACDTNYMHDDTSYVFSLNEKMWYRRSEKFYSFYRDYGCKKSDVIMNIEQNGEHTYIIDNAVVSLCYEFNGGVPREQAGPITVDTQVFILTRPLSLGNLGFKEIYHSALRGELFQNWQTKLGTIGNLPIDPNCPHLGFYVLASNDGGTWKMVGGKIFKESVSQVVLERVKQSYRFVAFMIAGYVDEKFNITNIDLDGLDKLNNRQR